MSILRRMTDVFQQKVSHALDQAEDPVEALDLSYQKQLEALQQVRRNVADVLTSEKRLEMQAAQLGQQIGKLHGQAETALKQGREDLTREALTRAQAAQTQLDSLKKQIEQVKDQEQKLETTAEKLQARIESFRLQKETMKAQYTAARAQTQVSEMATGLSENIADAGMMVDRAQDKVTQMQARAAAVGQLVDTGALDRIGSGSGDDIERQLQAGVSESSVSAQLEAMKQQMALPTSSVVVRVQGEGQFRLADRYKGELDNYDRKVVAAIEAGQTAAFKQLVHDVIAFVRSHGAPVLDSANAASQVVLPSEDLTLEEAKKIMAGDEVGASS